MSERSDGRQDLAKILVGYSTEVKEGEVVSIDGESAAAPLLLAVYEEVLKAGAQPGPQRRPRRADRRLLQARLRRPAGMDLALRRVDGRQRRRADRDRRQHQHPRALRRAAGAPDAAPVGHRRPDGAGDEAQRRGRFPLVLHALPDQRLRLRGGDEPGRLRRLLLRRLPGRRRRPAERLEARLGGDRCAWRSGSRATRRCG